MTVVRRLEEAVGIELFGTKVLSKVAAGATTPESEAAAAAAAAADSISAEAVGKNAVAGVGITTPST